MMNESDMLCVFGASFANHTGIAPYKPIVQIDSEPDALGRFHPVTVPVLGDIAVTARRLAHEPRDRLRYRRRSTNARRRDPARDLARGEGAPRHRQPRARRLPRPRCSPRSPGTFPTTR